MVASRIYLALEHFLIPFGFSRPCWLRFFRGFATSISLSMRFDNSAYIRLLYNLFQFSYYIDRTRPLCRLIDSCFLPP